MSTVFHFTLGALFGWILSRSGAADYDHIQAMFRFESFQLYGIIGTAVVVTAPGLWLLKRRQLARSSASLSRSRRSPCIRATSPGAFSSASDGRSPVCAPDPSS